MLHIILAWWNFFLWLQIANFYGKLELIVLPDRLYTGLSNHWIILKAGASILFLTTRKSTSNICEYKCESTYLIIAWARI